MTDEQLQQLAALAQAATPGPWEVRYNMLYAEDASPALDQDVNAYVHTTVCTDPCDDGYVCGTGAEESCHADAEFIAAARDAVPALVAEVERLRDEVKRLRMLNERIAHDEMLISMANEDLRAEVERLNAELTHLRDAIRNADVARKDSAHIS